MRGAVGGDRQMGHVAPSCSVSAAPIVEEEEEDAAESAVVVGMRIWRMSDQFR